MQIRITDASLDTIVAVLKAGGFGTAVTECAVRRQVETISVWTQQGVDGPQGFEVGIVRREVASFPRYEMVLETNRIPADRLTDLVGRLATGNGGGYRAINDAA